MPLVRVRELHRHYRQGSHTVRALDGVDLDIEEGAFTVLMGTSGSGKTTLLGGSGALDRPTSCGVEVDGCDLGRLTDGARADLRLHKIGFVFQSYNLIPVLSALENAAFVLLLRGVPRRERQARAREALALVGLEGLEDRRPAALSGGQQQRVAVARAIAARPRLILADEPTANLDSKTGEALVALMAKLNEEEGISFLFATHDPKVMGAARRLVRMEDGRIVEDTAR